MILIFSPVFDKTIHTSKSDDRDTSVILQKNEESDEESATSTCKSIFSSVQNQTTTPQ